MVIFGVILPVLTAVVLIQFPDRYFKPISTLLFSAVLLMVFFNLDALSEDSSATIRSMRSKVIFGISYCVGFVVFVFPWYFFGM